MSITFLEDYFPEEGAGGIRVSFTDTDGTSVAPNSGLTWTLLDDAGEVVNSRDGVPIDAAEVITIVLTGDDLALNAGESGAAVRYLLIQGTYNSSTLGNNVPLRAQCGFSISDFVGIT